MELGGWHPRDIPDVLLINPALQRQQEFTLPPLEQWYLMLLHDGVLPGAVVNRPNKAWTRSLLDDAKGEGSSVEVGFNRSSTERLSGGP